MRAATKIALGLICGCCILGATYAAVHGAESAMYITATLGSMIGFAIPD